jgi:hypothetical protein
MTIIAQVARIIKLNYLHRGTECSRPPSTDQVGNQCVYVLVAGDGLGWAGKEELMYTWLEQKICMHAFIHNTLLSPQEKCVFKVCIQLSSLFIKSHPSAFVCFSGGSMLLFL